MNALVKATRELPCVQRRGRRLQKPQHQDVHGRRRRSGRLRKQVQHWIHQHSNHEGGKRLRKYANQIQRPRRPWRHRQSTRGGFLNVNPDGTSSRAESVLGDRVRCGPGREAQRIEIGGGRTELTTTPSCRSAWKRSCGWGSRL